MILQVAGMVYVHGRTFLGTLTVSTYITPIPKLTLYLFRYLEPDPLLLVSAPGSRDEKIERNSKFHSLNQAIVQLVSLYHLWGNRSSYISIRSKTIR